MLCIDPENLPARMRSAVSLAWSLLSRKVGGGFIQINKEASLQLQYAYVLQQIMPLITFHHGEELELELETGARVGDSTHEIDVLLSGKTKDATHRIAIEMKCYRSIASSGKKRGATDIFQKDVYDDLAVLERYIEHGHADQGVALVMTDYRHFAHPLIRRLDAKCRNYDIANGTKVGPVVLDISVGGKDIHIELKRRYAFEWHQHAHFWFLEMEGVTVGTEALTTMATESCEAAVK